LQLVERGFHRAAARVTQYHDQSRAELAHRELHTADLRWGHDVPGDANDEQVAESLIEHDLGGHARVGATEDNPERFLPIGKIAAMCPAHYRRVTANVSDESFVAFAEPIECF
jgi:hypothetical protein